MKQTLDTSEVVKALGQGAIVICSMKPGIFTKSGHFIIVYNTDGKNFYVNDPNSKDRTGKAFSIDIFKKQCKQFFIYWPPKK
jgi:uncharacterized protein YvpB